MPVIYTQETYEQYPDVQLSNLSFKKSIRLTDGIRQQDSIIWGTAELTSWISLDGRPLEGVIYKPADFDPNKKYPVIVNSTNVMPIHYTTTTCPVPDVQRSTIRSTSATALSFSILMSASQTAIRVKVVTIA